MKIKTAFLFFVFMLFLANSCAELDKLTNKDPVIKNITADPDTIAVGGTVFLTVEAHDPDNNEFTASWTSNAGCFLDNIGTTVQWIAPGEEGIHKVVVTVADINKGEATEDVEIAVISDNIPFVNITQPLAGDFIVAQGFLEIITNVTPQAFIERVELYINEELFATDKYAPFLFNLPLKDKAGLLIIKCVAYRKSNSEIKGLDEIEINVQAIVPIPL
jgi:hypothetical protein